MLQEEEEDIYLTQIHNSHGNSTPTVTEPGCQKTRRSTMLAIYIIQKLNTKYTLLRLSSVAGVCL